MSASRPQLEPGEGGPPNRQQLREFVPDGWFGRDKHLLAKSLLGRYLVRRVEGRLRAGRIVEVEVYGGPHDPASHADSGTPTERTASMFGTPGDAYVYRIYGLYHCLNVVAPADEKAAAVLIRALEPLRGVESMAHDRGLVDDDAPVPDAARTNLTSGPGKICQALRIDRSFDGTRLRGIPLWIAPGRPLLEHRGEEGIEVTSRIGLNPETVGDAADWPWRYLDPRSEHLSR